MSTKAKNLPNQTVVNCEILVCLSVYVLRPISLCTVELSDNRNIISAGMAQSVQWLAVGTV
jgi:hypothetical protein